MILLHQHIVLIPFSDCSCWRPLSNVIVFSRFRVDAIKKVKTQRKDCGSHENDIKTYSCRRALDPGGTSTSFVRGCVVTGLEN